MHTAGKIDKKLPGIENNSTPVLYKLSITRLDATSDWKGFFESVAVNMTKSGADQGFMVSSTNDSKTDEKIVAVFSWGFNEAMKLEDLMRPTGCCTIF